MATDFYTYCPRCATVLVELIEGGQHRRRCPSCSFIHYRNPVPAVGGIIMRDATVCLVRRAVDPRKGFWSLPAGFMEYNESAPQCAEREVAEETGLAARVSDVLGVYAGFDDPRQHAILIVYWMEEADRRDPVAGDDADDVRFFTTAILPVNIAFRAHREALADAMARLGSRHSEGHQAGRTR